MSDRFSRIKDGLLDDMMAFITLCEPERGARKHKHHAVDPYSLKRIEPFTREFHDVSRGYEDNRIFLHPENEEMGLDFFSKPIDVCTMNSPREEDRKLVKYQITRIKEVTDLSTIRGKVPQIFPRIHSFTSLMLHHDGTRFSCVFYGVPFNNGLEWKFLAEPMEYVQKRRIFKPDGLIDIHGNSQNNVFRYGMSMAATKRYEWSVEMGMQNGGPTLDIIVPPRAILSLFKFRDVPDGKTRRASLRNWVSDHWRQSPEKDEGVYVRKHLRGAMEFTIDDMKLKIHPSEYDIEINERLRDERKGLYSK